MTKEQFIRDLIDYLNKENLDKINREEQPLNVCFIVSVIDQHIEKCKEFINDIALHKYRFYYIDDFTEDYTNGKLKVILDNAKYHYEIEFLYDERYNGFCLCDPKDEGYNPKHKCCGISCDWVAPAFQISKIFYLGYYSWDGLEKDYWEYEERFIAEEKK